MTNKYDAEIENLQEKLKSLKKKRAEAEKAKYSKIARLLTRQIQNNQNFNNDFFAICKKYEMKDLMVELDNFRQPQ
ncbi:hypothetical protein IXZ18_11040 (plasmid) [Campylobacter fetus subsp. venerealis bv. intermedius]|uniref:hypothetical protein n=1 Tax=Campylobacter fetus TaxID=196 RepID=UPI0003D7F3A4|nr:hypothetical protein [Campylobacter fetus]AHE95253.1 hypothetical protein CFVI03293_B0004 [Campylobacter fetus subsp. venerealis cfvi03/293]AIR81581.1 hypothetical protein CFV97608_a0034 [Campylobacter fetus subsp. venerealis 97/608]OCS23626.1 hypothetical protein CFVI9825_08170 [Campylobacter fetus subsp. venerealis cfvi9825]WKW28107.1 hypothetical protein IXZ24_10895 [Campylobacter fetus subsp. venerealis bv. intermedius]WKW30233.1 hypothetical protein IXZ18_11040 [Campylobacter fetus sub